MPAVAPMRERALLWTIDGLLLGLFMVSVGVFAPLLFAPSSPVVELVPSEALRTVAMGVAMGLTAVALIYSPLGAKSGALMNPALTLAFLRLGRIRPLDAAGYIVAQFAGGLVGVVLIAAAVGEHFTAPPVSYAPTVPGRGGVALAFAAEFGMTFVLMLVVLYSANTKRFARFTGVFAGGLLVVFITLFASVSGMSINPARSLASALPSGTFDHLWLYFVAPTLGMLAGAELFRRTPTAPSVHCCKLNHADESPCMHCGCDGPIDFDAHAKART